MAAGVELQLRVGLNSGEVMVSESTALLARAHGDETEYRDFADRYGVVANELGFEGHMAIAAAM